MRRWMLNGYMALIRSTSLTRSSWRISLGPLCVLSVNEVAETWKVPSEAAKWLLKIRKRKGGGYRVFRTPMVVLVTTPASRSGDTETYDCP
jgi:hypothetical protein